MESFRDTLQLYFLGAAWILGTPTVLQALVSPCDSTFLFRSSTIC